MSIKDLVSLANEFEQVSQTMQGPQSKIEIKRSPVEKDPITQQTPAQYESQMDFEEIAKKVHEQARAVRGFGDKIGPIKNTDYAGYYFGIAAETPAQARLVYEKITIFIHKHYPVQPGNSVSGHGWLELRYPEDDCVITLRHFQNEVTFKITTIEQ